MSTILIRGARQLLTLRGTPTSRRGRDLGDLGVVQDGAVLIRDGVVQEVGPTRRVENLVGAREAIELNAAGRVVMPGFVDSHTHLAFPPPQTDAAEVESALRVIRGRSAKLLVRMLRPHLHTMARHGTTTVEGTTGFAADPRVEMKLQRVVEALDREELDVIPTFLLRLPGESPEAAERCCRELLPRLQRRRTARFMSVTCDGADLTEARSEYLRTARELGFGRKLHVIGPHVGAAIRLAAEHVATSIAHVEHATEAEIRALAATGAVAILIPRSPFLRRPARARDLIAGGVPIALGSDFHPRYCPALNMQTVVALGCIQMGLTPEEAICAATINGAHALGCGDRAGSLERGKQADLLILNIPDYREIAHYLGVNLVHLTMKRGEIIYEEGRVAARQVKQPRLA